VGEVGTQTDLAAWLLACVQDDLDEADRWEHDSPDEGGYYSCPATRSEPYGELAYGEENCDCGLAKRRARVLVECDTKRRIIAEYQKAAAEVDRQIALSGGNFTDDSASWMLALERACKLLTLPYVDRDGYRADLWAPDGR
jgi:hypothetical protein